MRSKVFITINIAYQKKELFVNIIHITNFSDTTISETEIYFKTPDMDGGFTPGGYYKFSEEAKGDIKTAIKDYYRIKINQLYKQFEEL